MFKFYAKIVKKGDISNLKLIYLVKSRKVKVFIKIGYALIFDIPYYGYDIKILVYKATYAPKEIEFFNPRLKILVLNLSNL